MKKNRRAAAASAIALALFLTGCSSVSYNPDQSGVFLKKDGSLTGAEVESFDNSGFEEERYKEDELQAFVESEVSEYNQSAAGQSGSYEKDAEGLPVTINELSVASGTATLLLDYASAQDYLDFNGENSDISALTIVSAPEAAAAGISLEQMVDSEGNAVDTTAMAASDKYCAVSVTGEAQVVVNGKIAAVSSNVGIVDEHTVQVSGDTASVILFR